MADTRVVIDVDINTSPAAQGLRDLQQRFNAFTGSLNKNNAIHATASRQYADQLMNLVNSSKYFTAEMTRMQTAAGRLDKTLAKGQATMGQYFSARFLKNSTAAAQVLSLANARAAALQTQFFATSAAANGMRDAIAVRPYEAFNSALSVSTQRLAIHRAMLMQATTHMINFGKNTQWAGRQLMVGFTVPLTIFGGVAGKVFRELEEQAINFKKVYGDIFTTEAETQQALDAVKELSVEFTKYGIAVKDTMELAGVAAQSGLRNAELMAATTQATRLATLGQMDQAEAMKTIISLQTAFQTSNEGLAESVDFLNIIENQTVLALQDVAGAIPRVAPVIQGLGGDVKDLAVLLVAMKEGGVSAGEGANALKSSLGRLIVPTDKASKMARGFGINLEQIVENNRGELLPMIKELGMAMEGLGDLERQQLLTTIFGKFQYARIGALFDNITRDSSQAARAMDLMGMSAEQLGQIAEKELATVEQSVGAQFTAAMEKAKVAIAPLGEAFLQLSIPVINLFTKIVEKFNSLPDMAKKFAVFGSVLVGVVIPVGTMFLGLLMNLVGTLIKFGSIVGIAFKGFTSGGIAGAISAVSQALNYMSLEEIDAANAAAQLGTSTRFANDALRDQVPRAAAATAAIEALGLQYAELIIRMREAAALSATGPFAVPGAAMGRAAGAQRGASALRRNKGGPIPFASGDTVPGVGNTDTVPAILTPGEFVVNKKATEQNRGLLEAINGGQNVKRNKGGIIPGVQYLNPGGGVAAARGVASALKLGADDLISTQMTRRAPIGTTQVADDVAIAVTQRALTQLEQQRINNIMSIINREVAEGATISTPKLAQLLANEKNFSAPVLRRWAELNNLPRKGASEKSPRMWNKKQIEAVVREKIISKIEKSHFGTKQATASDVATVNALRPGDSRVAFAAGLHADGVPVIALTDDWARFSRSLNQAANRSSTEKMTVGQAIDDIIAHSDQLDFGPAMQRAGVDKAKFADDLVEYLRSNYSLADDFTDDILTASRNAVSPRISARTTGLRIPPLEDLAEWSSNILGRTVSSRDIASIDAALRTRGYRIVETAESGLEKRAIAKVSWRPGDPIERIGDSTAYNTGGPVVPGTGRSDTVPAMLTPGEFVVNKDATRRNFNVLKAINNGKIAGFNAGGGTAVSKISIPPMTTLEEIANRGKGGAIPVNVTEVSDKDTKAANKKAAKGGGMFANKAMMAQMGIGTLLSIPGMMGGQALGSAVGGDTGAMVGGMAGSMLPFLLPYDRIGKGIKGMVANAGVKSGKVASGAASAFNLSRFIPMLFNPVTAAVAALAAAMIGTAITLKKMGDSNLEEFEKGKKLGEALSTSTEEIKGLGTSAKERAKNIDAFLNQSEQQSIFDAYVEKIANAETKKERRRLIEERDREIKSSGIQDVSRREATADFYDQRIDRLKRLKISKEEVDRLAFQRRLSLGQTGALRVPQVDTSFGTEFITGQGKQQFEDFKKIRGSFDELREGRMSQEDLRVLTTISQAAYQQSVTVEKLAEKNMADKLAQYIISGVMTNEQAQSVAEAVGQELGDLRIGEEIRKELVQTVGVGGYKAQFTPGAVAMQMAQQDERRLAKLTEETFSTMNELITQDSFRDNFAPIIGASLAPGTLGATGAASWMLGNESRQQERFTPGTRGDFNIFNQFFSGMADQARRNIGELVELQSAQISTLLENIPAVSLAYDEMIAKAKTASEIENLRLEKSVSLLKLQTKLEDARKTRINTIFGSEEIMQTRLAKLAGERAELDRNRLNEAIAKDKQRQIAPVTDFFDNFTQIAERSMRGLNTLVRTAQKNITNIFQTTSGNLEETFPATFSQLYTKMAKDNLLKKYEGTDIGPYISMMMEGFAKDTSEEFALLFSEMLANEDFARAVAPAAGGAMRSRLQQGAGAGDISYAEAENTAAILDDILLRFGTEQGLQPQGMMDYFSAINSLNNQNVVILTELFESMRIAEGSEMASQVQARLGPLIQMLGDNAFNKIGGTGGKGLFQSIMGDPKVLQEIISDDKTYESMMRFAEFIAENDGLKFELFDNMNLDEIVQFAKDLDKFSAKKFNKEMKSIEDTLQAAGVSEELDQYKLIISTIEQLNAIEDPEVRAEISASIDDSMYQALAMLREAALMPEGAARDLKTEQGFNVLSDAFLKASGQIREAGDAAKKPKKKTGSGGTKDDPLGDLMRELRDTISVQASIGEEINATGQTAKAIYANLRNLNVDETIIDYLRSMGPEKALEVGEEVLKDRRKLNTLMALVAQETVTGAKDQAKQAEVQRKFTLKLANSKVMDGLSVIRGMELMEDPQFIEDMRKASQGPKPQKAMKEVRDSYLQQRKEQEIQMSRMMPDLVRRDIAENQIEQRATQQLSAQGLNQQQIDAALSNEAIMQKIRRRFMDQKNIGSLVVDMAKDYAQSQRTVFDEINDSVDNISSALSNVNGILSAAIDRIEKFSIKPLQEELDAITESSAEFSEQQRRLSNSLSEIQDQESDIKEEQKEKEESINDFYSDRIEALQKVKDVNDEIAQQQQGQLDLAGALSRGDIAAAAKAAQDIRNKAAAAKQTQAIENLRQKQQEEIDTLRENTEERIKNLAVEFNGELLTREEIEERIKDIQDKVYENSLLEYDLQQKITLERKKQAEIAEAQEKLNRGQNLINRIADLQNIGGRSPEEREANVESAIELIKAEASVLGGPAGENLIRFLNENVENLVQGKWDEDFIRSLTSGLSSFSTDFVADFDNLITSGLKIPTIDTLPDGERPDAVSFTPEDFAEMLPDIDFSAAFASASTAMNTTIAAMQEKKDEWQEEIVDSNPFDTLIQGTKTFKRVIKGAFAPIPKKPGSGGGGGAPEEEPDVPKPGDPEYVIPGSVLKELMEGKYSSRLQAGERYEENKLSIQEFRGGRRLTPMEIETGMRQSDEGYTDPTQMPGMGVGATNQLSPGAVSFIESIYNQLYTQDDTDTIPHMMEPLGRSIVEGVENAIATGALELDAEQIKDNMLIALESETGFNVGSPAKAMFPLGGYISEGIVQGIVNWFITPLTSFWDTVSSFFKSETGTENGASTKTGSIGGNLMQGIFNGLIGLIPGLDLWTTVSGWISGQLNGEGQKDDGTGSTKSRPFGVSLAEGIWNGLKTKIPGYGLWTTISSWFTQALGIGGEEGSEGTGSTKANPAGKSLAEGIWDGLKNWFVNETSIGKLGSSIFGWITAAITGKSDEIGDQGGEGSDDNKGIGSLIIDGLTNWAKDTLDLGGFVENMKQKFKDKQKEFEGVGETIGGWISSKINSAVDAAKNLWANAKAQFEYFGGPIKRAFGGNINYRPPMTAPPGMMFGGKMKKYAMGSFVPGIGNTDVVPALLTPGEFVVRKSVAQTYGPLLNALNSDVFPKMTMSSLMPSNSKTGSDGQVSYNYAINVNVSGSNASPDDIANTVMSKIKMMESRNIRGTRVG